jgi:electron transfer flavoprotein alpha/beta subunit
MNIGVCVKMVPSTEALRTDEHNLIVREGAVLITNLADESAFEAALRLKGTGTV